MKNINKIVKEKIILKYILDDISELKDVNVKELINDTNILDKSIEVTYKNKDKLLIIDYIKTLKSTRHELREEK